MPAKSSGTYTPAGLKVHAESLRRFAMRLENVAEVMGDKGVKSMEVNLDDARERAIAGLERFANENVPGAAGAWRASARANTMPPDSTAPLSGGLCCH